MAQPDLALILDVDGPLANPDTKRIVIPTIVQALRVLPEIGVPIVLNTGRSIDFIEDEVLAPMRAAGGLPSGNFHAVGEKGAVWLSVKDGKVVDEPVDLSDAVPDDLREAVADLVENHYSDTMFFDHTKQVMVSVERGVNVSPEHFAAAQVTLAEDLAFLTLRLGYKAAPRESAGAKHGFRVDRTTIATDLESVHLGKNLGAARVFALWKKDGIEPKAVRTAGDSSSDYAMADWVHANGTPVRHVDVNPSKDIVRRSYEVIRPTHTRFDAAGAAYLDWVLDAARGVTRNERVFDQVRELDTGSRSLGVEPTITM